MKTRDELQQEAVLTLAQHRRLIVGWGTGVGKSRVAIKSIQAVLDAGRTRILLLVGQTVHKANWKAEFIETLGQERGEAVFNSLTVECYESLFKYQGQEFDLIVADEAHHLRSDNRTEIITTIRTDYFLCLTATMSDNNDADQLLQALEKTFGTFARLDFGIQDAIDNGILSVPRIYVHLLPLDKLENAQVINIAWGKPWLKEYRREVECTADSFREIYEHRDERGYDNVSCNITCTTDEGYHLLSDLIDSVGKDIQDRRDTMNALQLTAYGTSIGGLRPSVKEIMGAKKRIAELTREVEFLETSRKLFGAKRKVLLGKAKTAYSTWLLHKLGNKKFICFCANVEQCKELGGENIIHAQKKDNTKVIEAFNRGDINSLFAVDMVKEGQNLKGIQAGVIIQLGGKERDFIQQFGRTMRSKLPEQHIVVINDTRDVLFYKNAVKTINPEYIKILRYGEKTSRVSV